jgi:hypothetical protein
MSTKRRTIRATLGLRAPSRRGVLTAWDHVGRLILRAKAERRALRGAD